MGGEEHRPVDRRIPRQHLLINARTVNSYPLIPPSPYPTVPTAAELLTILLGIRDMRNQLWMIPAVLHQMLSQTVVKIIVGVRPMRYQV